MEIYCANVVGQKRRFSNTMTSCLSSKLAILHIRFENATCVQTQIFFKDEKKNLHFRTQYRTMFGRSNTIRKCYVACRRSFFKYGDKNICFETTLLHVNGASIYLRLFKV